MPDQKQTVTIAASVLAGLLAGAGLHAEASPALSTSARPVVMRWLDEGEGKPNRYAITIATRAGLNGGQREVVCEADGSAPKLGGVVMLASEYVAVCAALAKLNEAVVPAVNALADDLVRPAK